MTVYGWKSSVLSPLTQTLIPQWFRVVTHSFFRNFNFTVPTDFVKVKSYVNSLFFVRECTLNVANKVLPNVHSSKAPKLFWSISATVNHVVS